MKSAFSCRSLFFPIGVVGVFLLRSCVHPDPQLIVRTLSSACPAPGTGDENATPRIGGVFVSEVPTPVKRVTLSSDGASHCAPRPVATTSTRRTSRFQR
jgi:hypothetical protein